MTVTKITTTEFEGLFTGKNVNRTYSGRVGCMCGCLGKYTEGLNDRILKNVLKRITDGEYTSIEVTDSYVYLENRTPPDTERPYDRAEGRCYAFYFEA